MCNFISVNNFKFRFFPPPPVFWYIFQKSIRTFKKLKLNYIKTDTIPIYFSKNNSVYSSNFIGIRTCANTSNGRNRNVQDCWQFTAATIIDAYPIRYVIGPSIERPTSNFCTRSRYDRDRRSSASIRCVPAPLSYFFSSFFSALLVFRFRNAVFLFHPDGHILRGRIYFWKRIKQISEGILPKEGDPFASIETFHRIKACIFARKNYQISFVHCTMQSRRVVSYASFLFPFVEMRKKRADNLIFTM